MEKRKLKKYLASVQVPEYSSQGLQETISQAKKIRFHPEKQRMTNLQFFRNQLYFIRKEFWGLKLLFTGLFLCLILSEPAEPDSWIWTFSAISGPMLCLANAKILCDIFQPGMLELQMTVKHSLRKILAFRLLLSGVLDFLTLACCAAIFTLGQGVYLRQTLLYTLVPYNLMCLGCLAILNRRTEENSMLYCMTWGAFLTFAAWLLKAGGFPIYTMEYRESWLLSGVLSALGVMWEIKKLLKFGGGNTDEIRVGTFV